MTSKKWCFFVCFCFVFVFVLFCFVLFFNILYCFHAGGIFDLFDGRMDDAFINDDNVKQWDDVMDKS